MRGDCSGLMLSLERKLGVEPLAAHLDPSGNVHGMPVACLCRLGPPALTELGSAAPALRPEQVHQIGIRSVNPERNG